jgi:hypothetical protein
MIRRRDTIRERKMPENLTHIETLARAHTDAAIKTVAEIMTGKAAAMLAQLNQREGCRNAGSAKSKAWHPK